MVTMLGSLLVTVTGLAVGGATGRDALVVVCTLTPVIAFPMLNAGAFTVAAICVYCAGVENPAGVAPIAIVAVPEAVIRYPAK